MAAITSAGVSVDRVYRGGAAAKSIFEAGLPGVQVGTPTFNQGDLMCYDSSVPGIRAVTSTADGANILGISPVSVVAGKLAGPYDGLTATNAAQAAQDFRGPISGFEASMKLNSGDAFTFGCKVYLVDGGDTQTVTITDTLTSGYFVGYYTGPAFTPATAGLTGPIHLVARFPSVEA
jgi:hypothetical protein